MTALIRRSLRPLLGVALFLLALGVLDKQLEAHSLAQVRTQLRAISDSLLLAAIGFAVVSYITLTFYDLLALRYVGRSLAYPKVVINAQDTCRKFKTLGYARGLPAARQQINFPFK